MNRRTFLLSAAGFGGIAVVDAKYIEPTWLQLTRETCRLRHPLAKPIRLLHISDLHACPDVPNWLIEQAVNWGVSLQPDLICVTGDFITSRGGFDPKWYQQTLRRLADAAPAFATLGNHDGGHWSSTSGGYDDSSVVREILDRSGVELLHNANRVLNLDGQPLRLVGVGDLWADEVDGERAFTGTGLETPTILMAHNPDSKDVLSSQPWDLMLSGHTHGGQMFIPLVGRPLAPVKDKRYVAGLGEWNGRLIHVSTGVGTAYGARINCRPEINLLTIC
jgi:predicted MPP superfamily phosphohydrolase